MRRISKGLLFLNTVRYLRPTQLFNQFAIRIKPKEQFWKYKKEDIEYRQFTLWIKGLDDDPTFMERFDIKALLNKQLTILNETREFNGWNYSDASHLWNFNVHYLEYLVPLYSMGVCTGNEKYKKKLNEILNNWYEVGSTEPDSNQAYTISLRVINQLIISGYVEDKQRLFETIYAQYRFLLNHQEKHLLGNHYLENLKTIVICSVVFGEKDIYRKYIGKLLDELDEEITTDGLHFELSLMYHKIVLEDLIRVAFVLKQDGKKEYRSIVGYISRMATALQSLEYGINRTPLFNDAGDNVAKPTETLLRICEKMFNISPEKYDLISGYYKLYDGNIVVMFDCGKLSPPYMPGHAHNDCLSFELFYDGKPIFVNAGTYQYQGEKRAYFRSTCAHNTVMINSHEQSELWGEHKAGRRIKKVKIKTNKSAVNGSYINYYKEQHSRKLSLDNGVLKVLDRTSGAAQSYLHLAPGLKYENGEIRGLGTNISIKPLNAYITVENMLYAESFGKIEEIECMVFSWNTDKKEHGYRIEIK